MGDHCGLRLEGTGVNPDRVYALGMDVERRTTGPEGRVWEGDVHFVESPLLIILGNYSKGGRVNVDIRCKEARDSGAFSVDFSALGPTGKPIPAEGRRKLLKAWRVAGSGSPVGSRGLTDEDIQKLRALGYVQ